MRTSAVLSERLRSHRLSAPAPTVGAAAAHMLATQSQEFWGGRWALACRTRGGPTLREVDTAFDRGEVIRSWTMRGTIHSLAPRDLDWLLSLTADRQHRAAAPARRAQGIDDGVLAGVEAATRSALAGGNRLTRGELAAVWAAAGHATAGQRGYHLLVAMCLRRVVVQGPVVERASGPTREQHLVLAEEWVGASASPADPLAEFFVRYIAGHGPAGPRDFAWWSGLPLGDARRAADAASDRLVQVAGAPEPLYTVAGGRPRRSAGAPEVVALPPFEEYYLAYADRTVPSAPEFLAAIGPALNGIVRPILVARGEVVGVWTPSVAVSRHADDPVPELFTPGAATREEIAAALERYRAFVAA